MAYVFKYSVRTGTPAADAARPGAPGSEGGAQPGSSWSCCAQNSVRRNQSLLGTVQEVLVEGPDQTGERFTGRTRGNRVAVFEGAPRLVGTLAPAADHPGLGQHPVRRTGVISARHRPVFPVT